ncbi:MAG: hypothetical protein OEY14_18625, partial [Myxococcales bacterium]|nr:hypothetical protein [Myxococcales bacterium]
MSALRPLARRVHPEPSRRRRPHRARPRSRARRLPRLRALALLAALASLLPSPSNAQVAARRAPRGELSGLELQIEGSLEVAQGGTLRLSLAAFEIRGTHDLRPSPHARLRATTPLDPAATPLELEADDLGRALLELPIPGDAPSRFTLLIEASQAGARRRFELPITVHSALRIELFSASRRVIPGERAHFFGRLVQRASGAGLAGATIELEADDAEGPIGAPTRLRTDASGLFEHTLELPLELSGRLRIRAALLASSAPEGHHAGPESIALEIWRPSAPPLLVRLAPERWSVPSGGTIGVELSVRRPDGRPVEGALISRTGPRPDPQAAPIRTDARGRARIEWTAPRVSGIADGTIQLLVREERGPRLMASAAVRLYEAEHAAELSVEGGALVEGLRQIVLARVVRVDGRPVPLGTRLRLEGPRLDRPIEGQTGADGVVRFEIRSGAAREGDRCGGVVSTALELYLGRDTEPLAPRCVPVDPDATLALSPLRALAHAGGTLRVRIERRSDVARAPLMLSLF